MLAACGDDDDSAGSTSTAAATTAAAPVGAPPASFGDGDLGIVSYALTLEHIEADFYARLKAIGLLST